MKFFADTADTTEIRSLAATVLLVCATDYGAIMRRSFS
jgi:hypothetical protein